MSKNNIEIDCTRRCKSRSHGQYITSAITKRLVSDEGLASFIKLTCANFTHAFDFEGRTALQMAASRGRVRLMNWLVRHSSEAFINARDRESGYTPLHRSIFYGQIHAAVTLIKMGVNTEIVDKDDYKALEHALLDRQYMYKHDGIQPSDVYVWGSNCNYTLGTGDQQQRNTPELLSSFSRSHTSIKQVCLSKFHSVWFCEGNEGIVWCCGQLGRAGGTHVTALRPVPLHLPEPCVCAATMLNSTVFLLQSGSVIQYSLNSADTVSSSNSKVPSTIKLPSVKPLMKLSQPLGVCASRYHAVVWNAHAIYTWGDNLGQLGHSQGEKVVTAPKRVKVSMNNKEETTLLLAGAADGATVFTTSRGDVYLLHKYICKKIAIKQINLRQVCVEGKVSDQGLQGRVTVLLLTTVGQLLIWQDTTGSLTRCVFGLTHQTIVTHVALTHDALYFTTKYGEAFIGHISRKTTPSTLQPIKKDKEKDNNKSSLVKFLEKDDCTSVKIMKIPNIHRGVSIAVDNEGLNFSCLQIKPTCGLTSLPELSPSCLSKQMEYLLETACEDDILHDVLFKVGSKMYPAHIFIVASNSEHLYKLYQEKLTVPGEIPVVTLENVIPEVFERILKYLYTGTCDVAEPGPCGLKIKREDLTTTNKKEKDDFEPELEITDDSLEVSAFEVYAKPSHKNKKKSGAVKQNVDPPRYLYCDPVKLVQAAAKRLQVLALHKLLDKFYYREGTIYVKESATFTKNVPPSWNYNSFPELVDTNVCSKNDILIPAHKCILAARLEYFYGMFMHSWTESKLLSKVTLPINDTILMPVINFLYTDKCPEVENCESIDFICSMLIVADQLFITRLREMCEIALGNLITLRNCSELCQFAHTYNATQLKQCCMEFIALNISSILENKSLDILEENLLEDITNYYCKFNPIMSSRIITPFYNAPSDDVVNENNKTFPVDLDMTDEDIKKDNSFIEITKKKHRQSKKIEYTENEKARMRYESVSSVTSLDLSNETSGDITLSLHKIPRNEKDDNKQEKWIEVPSSQQKQQKLVQARLKAVSNAKEILKETPTDSYTKLVKSKSAAAFQEPTSPSTSRSPPIPYTTPIPISPKDSSITDMAKSLRGSLTISHIGPKVSQKQRKKLASQGKDETLLLYMNENVINKLNVQSPPSQPKNPWKIQELPVATSSPDKAKAIEFNQILADQKKQKDDSSRIMTKPLTLTQLEDKAIEELERFYNVHEADEEMITVRRIELVVSSPLWVHTANK